MSEDPPKKSPLAGIVPGFRGEVKPFFHEHKWPLLFLLAFAAFILGFLGFSEIYQEKSFLDHCYLAMQLFTFKAGDYEGQIPWTLNIARFLAPVLTIISIIVIVTGSFYYHFELLLLRFVNKNHIVICGLGYIGPVMVKHFSELGYVVVAIERDPAHPEIEYCRKKGAVILIGDATERRILARAQVTRARYLFAVTGDDEENARVIGQVKEVIAGRKHSLNCYVHIVDPRYANFLRAAQIPGQCDSPLVLEFINIYQNSSFCILNCIPSLFQIDETVPDLHVIIIGLGRMGESLLVHLVKQWKKQFGQAPQEKITITIIDKNADDIRKSLIARYTALDNYCEIESREMNLTGSEFYEADFLFDADGRMKSINAIFICTPDESLNFASALYLNQKLQNNAVPIIIRTVHRKGFADFFESLGKLNAEQFRNLHAFPLVSCGCCIQTLVEGVNEIIAQALHTGYLSQRRREGAVFGTEPALRVWSDLDDEYRNQNRDQARKMVRNLNEKGYSIISRPDWDEPLFRFTSDQEVDDLAMKEHGRWMEFMKENGWKHGFPKDLEKKINPHLVAWDDLAESVREYDRNFIREYPSILALVDLKIVRSEEFYRARNPASVNAWNCPAPKKPA